MRDIDLGGQYPYLDPYLTRHQPTLVMSSLVSKEFRDQKRKQRLSFIEKTWEASQLDLSTGLFKSAEETPEQETKHAKGRSAHLLRGDSDHFIWEHVAVVTHGLMY